MDFQHLVSAQTSALAERLLHEQTEVSRRHVQALREALDAAAHEIATPADPGPDVRALTERLTDAVAEEVRRVRDEAAGAFDAQREQLDEERAARAQLASAVAQAHADTARLESELHVAREEAANADREAAAQAAAAAAQEDERRAEVERLAAALAEARSEAGQLSADLQAECARADSTAREAAAQAAAAAAQEDERRAEVERLTAALTEARSDAERLAADLQAERERADAAERDLTVTIEVHAEVEATLRQAQAEARQAAAAQAAVEAELAETRAALDRVAADAAGLRDQLARETGTIAGLEGRLADALDLGRERDSLTDELAARGARIQALEGTVTQREAHAHDLEARLQEAAQAAAQMLEDLAARELALQQDRAAASIAREELDAINARYEVTAARVHALEGEHAAQLEHQAQLQSRLEEAASLETRLREELAALGSDRAVIDSLRRDVDSMVALFDITARGLMELAGAKTSAVLLTELVKRLSIQFSRVALFRVKGEALEGEQQIGFDEAIDVVRHVLPLSADSLPARAARSGEAERLSGADVPDRTGLPFGGTPTAAVSLPIVLHGTTIAVVYADDADVPEAARGPALHESRVAFAQLLVSHVVALLVRHTHELKTLAELRDYAATLLREAREMYRADVEGGRAGDPLRSRLKENIDCASQLYAYRAAMEGTAAASLFDDQIAEDLAADTPFARDLAHVLGEGKAAESLIANP